MWALFKTLPKRSALRPVFYNDGVGFAKSASGLVLLGYYMFCGGRNPNDRLMQENRLTGYPQ